LRCAFPRAAIVNVVLIVASCYVLLGSMARRSRLTRVMATSATQRASQSACVVRSSRGTSQS
jgi:hypothetical protein